MKKRGPFNTLEFAIAMVGLAAILLVVYSMTSVRDQLRQNVALAQSSEALRSKVALARLWFEEAVSGDESIDLERHVHGELREGLELCHAMIDGGNVGTVGRVLPAKAPDVCARLGRLAERMETWQELTRVRWQERESSQPGSESDQAYDRAFGEIMTLVDSNLASVRKTLRARERLLLWLDVGLVLALVAIFGGLIGLVRRHRRMVEIRNAELEARVQERTAELSESVARLDAILDTAVDAIITIGEQGIVESMNPAAEQIFGYSAAEVVGQNVSMLMPSPDRQQHDQYMARYLETGESRIIGIGREIVGQRKDGTAVPLELAVSEVRLRGRRAFTGILRDITERKRAQVELQKAMQAAEAASQTKGQFLANMSHEIRTPMNGIIGMTELALKTKLSKEQREYLEMVKVSADALLLLLNDILDFSKIEAGKLELEHIPFGFRGSLEETVTGFALGAHQKGLELACHISSSVPDNLVGDPGRLRQIVVNLVGNAIKFTEQGEVVVRTAVESRSEEAVELHFSVSDTGVGIPPEKQEAVFAPFTQADGSVTRKAGGTGLGLTICTQLVALMGGRVWLESKIGEGSTFHFTARFELNQDAPSAPYLLQAGSLQGLAVLIVDDNATNRRLLEEHLLSWGMNPTTVESGAEALKALSAAEESGSPFKLALLDVNMPEMDGFSLAEEIKKTRGPDALSIMMLSSSAQPEDVARSRALGIAGYLTKPIRQSELLNAIMGALDFSVPESQEPLSAVEPAASERANMEPDTPPRACHILVAEDNLVNQRVIVKVLEKSGHSAVVAANGREALEALEREQFDIVLMDVQMPEMGGFEATAAVREQEETTGGHIPIVAMTAHAMKGDRERCLEAGMDDYVTKPIKPDVVLDVIQRRALSPDASGGAAAADGTGKRSSEGPGPESMFELSAALETAGQDLEILADLAQTFLAECPGLLAAIASAVEQGDAQSLERSAHTFKSTVAIWGARPAAEAALDLETMGRDGELAGSADRLADLERKVAILNREISEFLEGEPAG